MSAPTPTDDDLCRQVAEGDEASLSQLYGRYASPLYDFSARIVGRDAAPDVVQTTFVKAWGSLQRNAAPRYPKAWLYMIARNEAIDQLRKADRSRPTDFDEDFASLDLAAEPTADASPELALHDREIADLVWAAAAALNEESRSLLDMHLRHDLSSEEIADLLGVNTQNAYKKMSRLRASLEEAVADELLRRQRGECEDLDRLTATFAEDELSPKARRAISKHVRSCDVCQERRRRLTSPAALFSRLSPLPFTLPEMAATLERIRADLPNAPTARPSGGRQNRFARMSTLSKAAVIVGGVAIVAAVVIAWLTGGDDAGPTDPDDAVSTSHRVGDVSAEPVIEIRWTPAPDAIAYSVEWTGQPAELPDDNPDLAGDATGTVSPELPDGTWYFHLRTQGGDGSWTSTLHLGPYVIQTGPQAADQTATPAGATTTTLASSAEPGDAAADGDDGEVALNDCPDAPQLAEGEPPAELTPIGAQTGRDALGNIYSRICLAEPFDESQLAGFDDFYLYVGFGPSGKTSSSEITSGPNGLEATAVRSSGPFRPQIGRLADGSLLVYSGLSTEDDFEGVTNFNMIWNTDGRELVATFAFPSSSTNAVQGANEGNLDDVYGPVEPIAGT